MCFFIIEYIEAKTDATPAAVLSYNPFFSAILYHRIAKIRATYAAPAIPMRAVPTRRAMLIAIDPPSPVFGAPGVSEDVPVFVVPDGVIVPPLVLF